MDDMRIRRLLKTENTPFYIFDLDKLQQRIQFLRENLPASVELCYAVKANTFILEAVSRLVDRLEICSPGELRICRHLNLPESKFIISGVYKEQLLMWELMTNGNDVARYTVESMTQFQLLYETARENRKTIPVLLRLTSGNQFGLEEHEIEQLIAAYRDSCVIDICGIQYFSGTQKNSLKRLKREIVYVDQFLERLYETQGYSVRELEFGPGFPVAYFEGETFDEGNFLREFSTMLSEMLFDGKIVLELGRSIAASCGSYVTRVMDLKTNHQQNYAIVDGGIHHLVYYGQSMAMKHPVCRKLSSGEEEKAENWNICGSLCTVNDILVKQIPLPELWIGDVLVFENTGAYCMTEGISLFLSRDLPEVILTKENAVPQIVRDSIRTDYLNTPKAR